MPTEGPDLGRVIIFAGAILLCAVFALLELRKKARREKARREIREYWAEEAPGEMLSNCPMCKLPYPVSRERCPFCDRSRRKARMLRRDLEWEREVYQDGGWFPPP